MRFELSIPIPKGQRDKTIARFRQELKRNHPEASAKVVGMDNEFLMAEGSRSLITERVRMEFSGIDEIPSDISIKVNKDNVVPLAPKQDVTLMKSSSAYVYATHDTDGKAVIYQPTCKVASYILKSIKNLNRHALTNREFTPALSNMGVKKEPFINAVAKLVNKYQFLPQEDKLNNASPSTAKAAISVALGIAPKHPKSVAMVDGIKGEADINTEEIVAKIKESLKGSPLATKIDSILGKDFIGFDDCDRVAMAVDSAINGFGIKCDPKALNTLQSNIGDNLELKGTIIDSTFGFSQRHKYEYQIIFKTEANERVVFVSGNEFNIPRDQLRNAIGKENVIVHGEVLDKVQPVSTMFAGSTTMKLTSIDLNNALSMKLERKQTHGQRLT